MPPSDYKVLHDHGHHAAVVAPLLLMRVRAWYRRITKRDKPFEAYEFKGFKN